MPPAKKAQPLREAVVSLFSDRDGAALEQLQQLSEGEWRRNLAWLDGSGMALYLIDRLTQLAAEDVLPATIQARLKQNLADNRERTAWLHAEMCTINRSFEELGICFANLKGMTLCPESVPDPALRAQLDLDFLAANDQSSDVEKVMTSMGYHLHAIGQGTWEFKAGASRLPSMKDFYKARPQRCVEIHFVDRHTDGGDQRPSTWAGQLSRVRVRSVCGTMMPALSPADQVLNQALHLFGHLRGEYTRTSWALEFARHLRAYADQDDLWREVKHLADGVPQASVALGLSILLVEELFGAAVCPTLRSWTVEALPVPVALWASLYGRQALLGEHPGSKLYLLLEDALANDTPLKRVGVHRKLMPRRLPIMITHGEAGEGMGIKLRRYQAQASFILFRLRFHAVEGLRYALEVPRWRRLKEAVHRGRTLHAERCVPE